MNTPNIIWFASYPKSGNTWLRLFYAALNNAPNNDFKLNSVADYGTQCSSTALYKRYLGDVPAFENNFQIFKSRVNLQRVISEKNQGKPVYLKTHSINKHRGGLVLFDTSLVALAVVIVRNPFDILASSINHFDGTRSEILDLTNNPGRILGKMKPGAARMPVLASSWLHNVYSWLVDNPMPTLLLRYEDLKQDKTIWENIAKSIFGVHDDDKIQYAINATQFDNLKAAEQRDGFIEQSEYSTQFFNKGRVGYGIDELTQHEKDAIWRYNHLLAERLGYFYENGQLRIEPLNPADIDEVNKLNSKVA